MTTDNAASGGTKLTPERIAELRELLDAAERAAKWRAVAEELACAMKPIRDARAGIDTTKLQMLTLTNACRDAHGAQWGLTTDEMLSMVMLLNCASDCRRHLARFDALAKEERDESL